MTGNEQGQQLQLFRFIFLVTITMLDMYAFLISATSSPSPTHATVLIWFNVGLVLATILQYAAGVDRAALLGYLFFLAKSAMVIVACNRYCTAYFVGFQAQWTLLPLDFAAAWYVVLHQRPSPATPANPLEALLAYLFPGSSPLATSPLARHTAGTFQDGGCKMAVN
jgi:hypothetical protein